MEDVWTFYDEKDKKKDSISFKMETEDDKEDMEIAFGMVEGTWEGSDLAKKESNNYNNLNEVKQQWTLTKMIETKEGEQQIYHLKQKEKRRQQTSPKKGEHPFIMFTLKCNSNRVIIMYILKDDWT